MAREGRGGTRLRARLEDAGYPNGQLAAGGVGPGIYIDMCGTSPSLFAPMPKKLHSTVFFSKYNVAVQSLAGVPAQTSGIYAGWASVGSDPTVYPMALSVGWNPHFHRASASDSASHRWDARVARAGGGGGGGGSLRTHASAEDTNLTRSLASISSTGKTLEPWILHDFDR